VVDFEEGAWEDGGGDDTPPLARGVRASAFSIACMHCEEPSCREACPSGAISKLEDGTVLVDPGTCTACAKCVEACPFGMIHVHDGAPVKCDLCVELRAAGERPACVAACPMRALEVGPLDELRARHGENGPWALFAGAERTRPAILVRPAGA
jgi:anaerobic dimethyl sulfoxide reductase subunit B (iron-sulfur subunit)